MQTANKKLLLDDGCKSALALYGFSLIVEREEVVRLICSSAISTVYAAAIAAATIAAQEEKERRRRREGVVLLDCGAAGVVAVDDLNSAMDCLSCEWKDAYTGLCHVSPEWRVASIQKRSWWIIC